MSSLAGAHNIINNIINNLISKKALDADRSTTSINLVFGLNMIRSLLRDVIEESSSIQKGSSYLNIDMGPGL